MRSLRFIFISIITFLFVTNVVFLRRTVSVLLCGVLSFNSTSCYSFLDNYGKADAAAPLSRTFALSNSSSSDTDVVPRQKQKVAGCLFGVCVDLPKIPVSISGIPGGDQKEPIQQANPQSNVSLAGKWQSDWGLVEFNSDLTGHWNQGSGIGQIKDGTYDPKTRKLVFHYYQPWNDMNGTATLTLSEDGNRLLGTWTQQRASNPPGSGGSGGWTMTRNPSQQSVGDARKPLDGKPTIVSLAGKWQSNWGQVEFNSDLSGQWDQGVGIGQIKDGTYDPQTRKLVFHYYQPWNEMDGTTTMMLSEDGNQLSGSWTQQRGSDPPGSGGSGGWVMTRVANKVIPAIPSTHPCNDNELQVNYDKTSTDYHSYTVKNQVCLTKIPGCTRETVFSTMLSQSNFIAPTSDYNPVTNCKITVVNLAPLDIFTPSTVRTTIGNYSITNYTRKDHALHPGLVTRSIIEQNGSIFIYTFGEGTGSHGTLNETYAPGLWTSVDKELIRAVEEHLILPKEPPMLQ